LRHQTMDKVQKHNSFNTNTPSSESYRNYLWLLGVFLSAKGIYLFYHGSWQHIVTAKKRKYRSLKF